MEGLPDRLLVVGAEPSRPPPARPGAPARAPDAIRGEDGSPLPGVPPVLSDARVGETGVDHERGHALPEWWRVVEIAPLRRARLIFIEEEAAETFARYLVAERDEPVLLEHWRDGECIDVRIVARPPSD